MRIVFNLLDAGVGGGQRVAAGIASALAERGHSIGVAVPERGPALEWFEPFDAEVHIVDLVSLRRPQGVLAAARQFASYDVVYSHTSVPGEILAASAAQRAGARPVAHRHVYPHFSPLRRVARLQRTLYARAARQGRMIAVAPHVADAAAAAGVPRDLIDVIPNGVALPVASTPVREHHPVRIGVLARLDPQKGIDLFAEAARATGLGPADALFALGTPAPETDAQARLLADAASAGLEIVSPAKGKAFLADLDIVVLPSRTFEGLPLTLLEALALGKPVVATDVPGLHDVLHGTEAGVLVAPDDAEALANALRRLALDAAERVRLGARARKLAEHQYSLESVHARVVELLERVASGH